MRDFLRGLNFVTACAVVVLAACAPAPDSVQTVAGTATSTIVVTETATPTPRPSPTATRAATHTVTPAAAPSATTTARDQSVTITVDGALRHQIIDGFGATHLPLVYQDVGDVLGPELRAEAIEAVYGQVGITLGNVSADLLESRGGWDERANDNADPFTIDSGGFQTFQADVVKEKLIDLAQPFGFTDFYLAQPVNLRWASPWLGEIRSASYSLYLDEAAEQVVAGQTYWRDTFGIVPQHVQFLSEPFNGNNLLLDGRPQEPADLVARAGARLREAGFEKLTFVVPNDETVRTSLQIAGSILSDPQARPYVGAIGYHTYPYGSAYSNIPSILSTSGIGRPDQGELNARAELRALGQKYGLPVWMTEVSHGDVDPRSYAGFRARAIHIHDELVYAAASAYFGMLNLWDTYSQEVHFGNRDLFSPDNEGTIVFVDLETKTVHISGMGYAIGHYARWLERGAVRIEASSNDALLQVVAFRDDQAQRFVAVIINNTTQARTVDIRLSNLRLSGNLGGEQSTAEAYWQALPPMALGSADQFQLTVPGESVTTLAAPITGLP